MKRRKEDILRFGVGSRQAGSELALSKKLQLATHPSHQIHGAGSRLMESPCNQDSPEPGMMAHTCNLSTQEAEDCQFKSSPGYAVVRSCLE